MFHIVTVGFDIVFPEISLLHCTSSKHDVVLKTFPFAYITSFDEESLFEGSCSTFQHCSYLQTHNDFVHPMQY